MWTLRYQTKTTLKVERFNDRRLGWAAFMKAGRNPRVSIASFTLETA